MERKPHSTSSIVGAVVLLVVVLLALYVGGYFMLGKYDTDTELTLRDYDHDWHVLMYRPVVNLEAALTGKDVWLRGPTKTYACEKDGWHTYKRGIW